MSLTKYIKTKDSIKQELRELSQSYNRAGIKRKKVLYREMMELEKELIKNEKAIHTM